MPTDDKVPIPGHVLPPGATCDYVEADPSTRGAGLGYAVLRALGAREDLSVDALHVIGRWSAKYGADHGSLTPNPRDLKDHSFAQRLSSLCGAPRAAKNAACYPGDRDRPRYSDVYGAVWVEQLWPELCRAIASATPRRL